MKFKLDFKIPASSAKINHKESLYLVGSCFSDNMGGYLKKYKFETLSNPFGTIYNPISILKLMSGDVRIDNLVQSQGICYHWDAHGYISSSEPLKTQRLIEQRLHESTQFLKKTNWIIITLGSAWVYRHLETDQLVANCHKVPQKQFKKELLTSQEISDALSHHLKKISRPDLNVIFTVSPVRHIRDGLIENNRSKAVLLEAVHTTCEMFDFAHYFPAYEILIDELRDYRFYAKDLVHPSEQAVQYIWEKFSETYLDQESKTLTQELSSVFASMQHSPTHPKTDAHQRFLKNTLNQLRKLNEKTDLRVEIELLTQLIS
ncbi:MAG: GSCFA domain-containing protein [Ekhidna sp.]